MRAHTVIIMLFFHVAVIQSQTKWSVYSNGLQENTLKKIRTSGTDYILAVGESGTIVRSTNGGKTWDIQQVSQKSLHSVFVVNSQTSYCVGENGALFSTKNGGMTWVENKVPFSVNFNDLWFVSNDTGWVVGDTNLILYTNDGGKKWSTKQIQKPTLMFFVNAVQFITRSSGWMGGYETNCGCHWSPHFFHTSDGGNQWNKINYSINKIDATFEHVYVYSMQFVDEATGWFCGNKGGSVMHRPIICKTNDSGRTWTEQLPFQDRSTTHLRNISSPYFHTQQNGWIIGQKYTGRGLYHTIDGGDIWQRIEDTALDRGIHSLTFIDSTTGWICGEKGLLLKTTNKGNTWISCSPELPFLMHSVVHQTKNIVWSIGSTLNKSVIAKSITGGKDWNLCFSDSTYYLATIHCVNRDSILVFGHKRNSLSTHITIKTGDGGISWSLDSTEVRIDSYFFLNKTIGFALAHSDTAKGSILYQTNDCGNSWTKVGLVDTSFIHDLSFTTPLKGYCIASDPGKVFATTDGGLTWKMQLITGCEPLKVTFIDSSTGWICGLGGAIFKTSDGGKKWIQQKGSGTTQNLLSLSFINKNQGWAIGSQATILSTRDGGTTWKMESPIVSNGYFTYLHITDSTAGWIVSDKGIVLTTSTFQTVENTIPFSNQPPQFLQSIRVIENFSSKNLYFLMQSSMNKSDITIKLYGINGRLLQTCSIYHTDVAINKYRLSVPRLAAGTYICHITINSLIDNQRFIHTQSLCITQ